MDINVIAERLKILRLEKKISQSKLADDLNISRVSMSYYETGSRCPDVNLLIKFADYFGVSLDYLAGRSDIKSIDTDIQAICEYTGLSEKSVGSLREVKLEDDFSENFGGENKTYGMTGALNILLTLKGDDFDIFWNSLRGALFIEYSNFIIVNQQPGEFYEYGKYGVRKNGEPVKTPEINIENTTNMYLININTVIKNAQKERLDKLNNESEVKFADGEFINGKHNETNE